MAFSMDGLLAAMMGRTNHCDEEGLLRHIWEEAHQEDAVQLRIRYETERLQSYACFPPAFFDHLCAEGLESAIGIMASMATHTPVVGGGAAPACESSDEESDEDQAEDDPRPARRRPVRDDDGDEDGISAEYPVMDLADRRKGKTAIAATHAAVSKKSRPQDDYDQPHLGADEAFTEYDRVEPLYKRCRLLGDVHEKYAAHLVDDVGREVAFHGLRDLLLPYLTNSDAYSGGTIAAEVIQEELELHAQSPQAWCNALYRAGVKPWTVSLSGTEAQPSLIVTCGMVDPPAQDVGDIADEDIDAASHEDMRGITGDYMVATVTMGVLGSLPRAALQALTTMRAFAKAASVRLFVINAEVEVNQRTERV